MKDEIRFNADSANSLRLRQIQTEYRTLHVPGRVSLEWLVNRAAYHGIEKLRAELNLPNHFATSRKTKRKTI